ncbi:MAG: glycosyltransferase family 1 protein [Chlamydiales bacterium]|nr:glycosyltransferase family 1 protein [Chlamydiales bacterium]
MKIAWTAFVLDGGRTGIATYVFNMLQALSQIDRLNDYNILMPEGVQKLMPPLGQNFTQTITPAAIEKPLANIAWHNTVLPWQARGGRYDLIHIPSIRRIPLVKTCPIIATVHDMAVFNMPDKYDTARTIYHRHFLSRLIHRCDHIITVSNYTRGDIIRFTNYPEEQISVIYSGIDHTTFRPLPRIEAYEELHKRYGITDPFIVYVSRVEHPAKNHLNLIKAFELFKKRHPTSHRLVLAGPDWSGAEVVKAYARDSRYRDSIQFLGSIPREDIVRLYSACDFMAFPSLFEGFGFPLLEAMACGAPVICSKTTSLGELAQNFALTFDPKDPKAICSAMISIMEDSYRDSRVRKAKEYAATFDWHNAAREVLKVYASCAK